VPAELNRGKGTGFVGKYHGKPSTRSEIWSEKASMTLSFWGWIHKHWKHKGLWRGNPMNYQIMAESRFTKNLSLASTTHRKMYRTPLIP